MVKTSQKTVSLCMKNIASLENKTRKQCISNQISRGITKTRAKTLCKTSKSEHKRMCSIPNIYSSKEVRKIYKKEIKTGYINKPSKKFSTMLLQLDMFEVYPKIYKVVRL